MRKYIFTVKTGTEVQDFTFYAKCIKKAIKKLAKYEGITNEDDVKGILIFKKN